MGYQLLYGSDWLLFDSITKKPMTTRELSHMLQLSEVQVAKRMKRFAEMDPPLVVKRSPDRRWVPCVIMRVETAKETVDSLWEDIPIPSQPDEPAVKGGKVVYPEVAPPPVPAPARPRPEVTLPPPPPKKYQPPKPRATVSERAAALALKLNVPAERIEYGEVNIAAMGGCVKCGNGTPLHYGGYALCPKCARA